MAPPNKARRKVLAREGKANPDGSYGSVSTCARWRIPVVVGYAAARFGGMNRDAVPHMSINGHQASV